VSSKRAPTTVTPEFPATAAGSQTMKHASFLTRRWPALRGAQWATVAVLIIISEAASWSGHAGASYVADGAALLAFLGSPAATIIASQLSPGVPIWRA
jgi:hypothetical protein